MGGSTKAGPKGAWCRGRGRRRWGRGGGRPAGAATGATASTSSTGGSEPSPASAHHPREVEVEREESQVLVQHLLAAAAAAPPGVPGRALVRHRREAALDGAAALAAPDDLHPPGVERGLDQDDAPPAA